MMATGQGASTRRLKWLLKKIWRAFQKRATMQGSADNCACGIGDKQAPPGVKKNLANLSKACYNARLR
jgi:hypothetical protein